MYRFEEPGGIYLEKCAKNVLCLQIKETVMERYTKK